MDIKLDVKMEQVVRAIIEDKQPVLLGHLVFTWDNSRCGVVVCGAYCGLDEHYDSKTGELVSKRYKVKVYSWDEEDQDTYTFDKAVCVCDDDLPIVVTESGTGKLLGIRDTSCLVFDFKTQTIIEVSKCSTIMFDWHKIKGDN